jgi:hypothetical protein
VEQEGVTVGVRLGDDIRTDRAAGAAHVLDDDRLAEGFRQALREEARQHVGRAAGREGDDHPDRARGEGGLSGARRSSEPYEGQRGAAGQYAATRQKPNLLVHCFPLQGIFVAVSRRARPCRPGACDAIRRAPRRKPHLCEQTQYP